MPLLRPRCVTPGSFALLLRSLGVTRRSLGRPNAFGIIEKEFAVKLLLEIVLALFAHPIAVVLAWIDLARRDDLNGTKKLLWAVICLLWGVGPILYVLLTDGGLW